jgi:transposase InsO family protein
MERQRYNTPYSAQEKLKALNRLINSTVEFVAHVYHCSERSIWRWKKQYDGTLESLANKSSRPFTPHPNRHTDDEIKHIRDLMRRNPDIGLNELYGKLRLNYAYNRNPTSLYRFLKKNCYYLQGKKHKIYKPKPYDTPSRLGVKWQLDVKVIPKECKTDGVLVETKFYQYTMLDEASRERFIYPYMEQSGYSSVDFLRRALVYFRYKPKVIQTDNGAEFTNIRQTDRVHFFDKACGQLNIFHKLIKPRTPRHNGKVERSHRNDNERFYKWLHFYSYDDLILQMKAYLERSNNIPSSVLHPRGGRKCEWLTPKQKRAELLLLDHGITE